MDIKDVRHFVIYSLALIGMGIAIGYKLAVY